MDMWKLGQSGKAYPADDVAFTDDISFFDRERSVFEATILGLEPVIVSDHDTVAAISGFNTGRNARIRNAVAQPINDAQCRGFDCDPFVERGKIQKREICPVIRVPLYVSLLSVPHAKSRHPDIHRLDHDLHVSTYNNRR